MGDSMYKVIIADDEIHICMLLRKLIDWEKMGIEIVGEYTDGDETLKAIYEKRPDIVITDVMMPGISGLDIVKQCNADKISFPPRSTKRRYHNITGFDTLKIIRNELTGSVCTV